MVISMKLCELLNGIEILGGSADMNTDVGSPRYDSRQVEQGDVFVAIPGFQQDGLQFVPMARQKGASLCVCERDPEDGLPYVQVKNARRALALMSANWFDHPADKLKMIAVTGTNGKTTVTYLLKQILTRVLKARVGVIGTISCQIGDREIPSERTTPESYDLQKLLAQMASEGCDYVVMEASSHALYLDRIAGVEFETGIFTNLTQDHLDFHVTMENYMEAKALLFSMSRRGVINTDDDWAEAFIRRARCPVTTYGTGRADIVADNITLYPGRVEYTVSHGGISVPATVHIPGQFTVSNSLAVIGCCLQLGISLRDTAAALSQCEGVPGRMEVQRGTKDFTVLIDYAHTPDALENVLTAVRKTTDGRIISLFGCGGDRDRTKRPIMGKIGVTLSDYAYITSDNPRTEQPMDIIRDILAGIPGDQTNYTVICDRREAIRQAVLNARKGDVILLAGKGHETYQIIGKEKTHLDEREEVAAALMLKYDHGTDTTV